ncbi:hypothetical protein TWF718_007703 [Orbilia javanica]|uniref:Uncharacterized protein n=1 Tax=Orbilia javanica TaxID=47235 RepID=A0AAN8MZN8_9PEZI
MLALQLNKPIYTLDIGVIALNSASKIRNKLFQFLVPEFSAHRYPAPPLPRPLRHREVPFMKLYRPTPPPPVVGPPLPTPELKILDHPPFQLKFQTFDNLNYIPTNRDLPQDLIFSITRDEYLRKNLRYNLKFIQIVIPVLQGNDLPENPDGYVPLLQCDYDPPYPTMLSKLRFNIFKRFSQGRLIVELIPRHEDGM